MCNEAESGSLALRLTPSPSEASSAGHSDDSLGQLHGERAITMVSTFQLTRPTRLSLTHQEDTERTEKECHKVVGIALLVLFLHLVSVTSVHSCSRICARHKGLNHW